MTMTVRKHVEDANTPIMVIRVVGTESNEVFKEIIRRAFNTWDQAPYEAKEFADMVEFGRPLQNYQAQSGEPKE